MESPEVLPVAEFSAELVVSDDAPLEVLHEPVKPDRIMTKDEISAALEILSKCDDAEVLYLPEFFCNRHGIQYMEEPLGMKEVLQAQAKQPKTKLELQQERMRKKLAAIKNKE
jgi:hypothetical protein